MTKSLHGLMILATSLGFAEVPVLADDHTFASADAARELVYLLDSKGINAIAAADPLEPGRFVAALYIPRSQLLVISARHPSLEGIEYRIEMGQFREVYLDLQGTPTVEGKFFVQDAGADGILSVLPGSGAVDVLYEGGVRQMLFNGDIAGQRLTRAEYDARLEAASAAYAHLLKVLTAALQQALSRSEEHQTLPVERTSQQIRGWVRDEPGTLSIAASEVCLCCNRGSGVCGSAVGT
jgi:hypothetical protein